MFDVYAYKTAEVTSAGNAVYEFLFAHDFEYCERDQYKPNRKIAARVHSMADGDDTFYNVLEKESNYVILNAEGEIDIDTEAQDKDRAVLLAKLDAAQDVEWDETDDDYIKD